MFTWKIQHRHVSALKKIGETFVPVCVQVFLFPSKYFGDEGRTSR